MTAAPPLPQDPGSGLGHLFASQGGVARVFSTKALDYRAARPDYPAALFDALRTCCPATPGTAVADVGAGTGLLTQGLLACGYAVLAVEPSEAMRAAADARLGTQAHYRSVPGTAEALPVADASLDLITAAQAFHWFDAPLARAEFLRALRPQGLVALIWNERVAADPLHLALDGVLSHFGGTRRKALAAHEDHDRALAFFGAAPPTPLRWPHTQALDRAGLLSLVFSRSYMPERESPEGQTAAAQLGRIFERLNENGVLQVRYTTVALIGRPA